MGELRYRILGYLGGVVLSLLNMSLRWERRLLLRHDRFFRKEKPVIVALWHSRQLMGSWIGRFMRAPDAVPIYVLISRHGDGRMIAHATRLMGLHSVAGSSSRGGREAARQLIALLKQGNSICITPDGPRGPAEKCKLGIIKIAQMSGAPILPVSAGAAHFWRVRSWDRMIIPVPFSRAVGAVGAPLYVPSDVPEDRLPEYAHELERRLAAVDHEVDCNAKLGFLAEKESCTPS